MAFVSAAGAALPGGAPAVAAVKSSPADLVTATDVAAQAAIFSALREHYPHFAYIGEEGSGGTGGPPPLGDGPTWIVDPIDGTTNFVAGLADVSAKDRLFHLGAAHSLARHPSIAVELGIGHRCLRRSTPALRSVATVVASQRQIPTGANVTRP